MRVKSNFLNRFNVIWVVQSPLANLFGLCRRANHLYDLAPFRPDQEGRIAIVTKRWARNAVDARVSLRAFGVQGERCQCGRRSRVVLTPRRWRQGRGFKSAADGGKRARSPGRARSKRNTTARGKQI